MTECKIRNYTAGDLMPCSTGFIALLPDHWYPCEQPDIYDDKEFNLIVFIKNKKVFCNSIDFEFREVV